MGYFRFSGAMSEGLCHVSDLTPLKGVAESFQIGECVEMSERKRLQTMRWLPRWLSERGVPLEEDKVVVEVCDLPSPGVAGVKACDGRLFWDDCCGNEGTTEYVYVPVSVLTR